MEEEEEQLIKKVKFYPTHNYFVPFECFAGSETCFFSFLFWSFSLCNFLCCSKPAAFFSLLDKTSSTLTGNRSVKHSKALSFCLHLKGVYSLPTLPIYLPYNAHAWRPFSFFKSLSNLRQSHWQRVQIEKIGWFVFHSTSRYHYQILSSNSSSQYMSWTIKSNAHENCPREPKDWNPKLTVSQVDYEDIEVRVRYANDLFFRCWVHSKTDFFTISLAYLRTDTLFGRHLFPPLSPLWS